MSALTWDQESYAPTRDEAEYDAWMDGDAPGARLCTDCGQVIYQAEDGWMDTAGGLECGDGEHEPRTPGTRETRHSICATCSEPISITIVVGEQRWPDVEWAHADPMSTHPAAPELRMSIDATCPSCDYPEIGFAPARGEFVCSRCRHIQAGRPAA